MTAKKKDLQFTGEVSLTFATSKGDLSVDPGQILTGDVPDRADLLASGWFKEVSAKPAKVKGGADGGEG